MANKCHYKESAAKSRNPCTFQLATKLGNYHGNPWILLELRKALPLYYSVVSMRVLNAISLPSVYGIRASSWHNRYVFLYHVTSMSQA